MKKRKNLFWLVSSCLIMIFNVFAFGMNDSLSGYISRESRAAQLVNNDDLEVHRDNSIEIIIPSQNEINEEDGLLPSISSRNGITSRLENEEILNEDFPIPNYDDMEYESTLSISEKITWQYDLAEESYNIMEILPDVVPPHDYSAKEKEFEVKDVDNASMSSSLPDLTITSVTVTQSQGTPLQALTHTKVAFFISNIGTSPAQNATIGLYANNTLLGEVSIGVVPMNASGTITLDVPGGFKYGSNSIRVTADPLNRMAESNKNNNSFASAVNFTGLSNLQVTSLELLTSTGITTMKPIGYSYNVTNNGNAPSSSKASLDVYLDGSYIGGIVLPVLDTYDMVTGSFSITFGASGNHNIKAQTTTNGSRTQYLFVDYDIDVWAGKWSNAKKLSVQARLSAIGIFSREFLESYLTWNSITNNVSFQSYQTDPYDTDLGADFEIRAEKLTADIIGKCVVYKKSGFLGLGELVEIKEENLFIDSSNYAKAIITLDTGLGAARTVTHEFGHGLGLAHPECIDSAIMCQTASPYHSLNIEGHDRHSLKSKY